MAADVGAELVRLTTVDARLHVRSVTLTAPPLPQAKPADPNVADALRAGLLPSAIVAAATSAGWTATGADIWLPTEGPVPSTEAGGSSAATPSPDESPSLLVAARMAAAGAILEPIADEVTGAVTTAILVEIASDGPSSASARQQAADSGIDAATLDTWAQAQQLRRAVTDHLMTTWTTTPIEQVKAAELVLGAPPDGGNPGPYVELSHLVLKQLGPPSASSTPDAATVASQLRALPLIDRLHRFAELVHDANATATTDLLARSGEVGVLTANNLTRAISSLAFAPAARSGDILGPVQTAEGDELFLVEARYAGALDDATVAALIAARDPATDFAAMAGRINTALVARARSGPWRARPEFAASDPAASLTAGPVGVEADPVVIDGQLLVARVLRAPHRAGIGTARRPPAD